MAHEVSNVIVGGSARKKNLGPHSLSILPYFDAIVHQAAPIVVFSLVSFSLEHAPPEVLTFKAKLLRKRE